MHTMFSFQTTQENDNEDVIEFKYLFEACCWVYYENI